MLRPLPIWLAGSGLVALWCIVFGVDEWALNETRRHATMPRGGSHQFLHFTASMAFVLVAATIRFVWSFIRTRRPKSKSELIAFAATVVASMMACAVFVTCWGACPISQLPGELVRLVR